MSQLAIDSDYLLKTLTDLLHIPSPIGYTAAVLDYCALALRQLGLAPQTTLRSAVVATWQGVSNTHPRAVTAHVDTLGAMVKEIKPGGRLRLARLGGFVWNAVEGESCQVFTSSGKTLQGSLMPMRASAHIYGEQVGEMERSDYAMEVRLDELTLSIGQTRALGVEVGNFVAFDPRVVVSDNGFIRARYLDDKAGVACVLAAVQAMQRAGVQPGQTTTLHICDYEEVGFGGAAGFPADLAELVAVDIGVVGEGQNSDETRVTICAKDAAGPYHPHLTRRLRDLAEIAGIPYRMDIFPNYQSDAKAYWRAGGGAQIALIGPGVDSTHHYERTHIDALMATAELIAQYLSAENKVS